MILERADWPVWLGEVEGDVPALLRPLPEGVLRMWPIDKKINKVGSMTDRCCSISSKRRNPRCRCFLLTEPRIHPPGAHAPVADTA